MNKIIRYSQENPAVVIILGGLIIPAIAESFSTLLTAIAANSYSLNIQNGDFSFRFEPHS